jgi:hypothetical protein
MHRNARRAVITLGLVLSSRAALAQRNGTPHYLEYRADAIGGRQTAAEGGVGLTIPAGLYVRVAAIGALGSAWRDGRATLAGRTDVIARFLLDPLRQMPVALSAGGGISVPYQRGREVRPYLTAVIDLEGRRRGRFTPALQLGLGGGTRLGIVLRTSPIHRR